MQLRAYQAECIMAVQDAWERGVPGPAVVMPTGSGKTLTMCALAVVEEDTHVRRPLILVHRDELVRQTVKTLEKVLRPGQKVGVIQGSTNTTGHVVVASLQTLSRKNRLEKLSCDRFDTLIYDEAHATSDNPSGRRIMEHFDKARRVGFTATMVKSGKHKLAELWTEAVFVRDTEWAITQGFLVPVKAKTVILPELDTRKVKVRQGDFAEGDLGKAMTDAKAGPLIAAAYSEHARTLDGELRRGILFAPTIDTAYSFAEDFRAAGIPTEVVIGETPIEQRQAVYAATRTGANKVISSVSVLVEGFDLPAVEVAVMARPTKSVGRYVQGVGRALRLSPETGKTDALILDCVGSYRLGLATAIDLDIKDHLERDPDDETPPGQNGPRLKDIFSAPDEIGFVDVDPFAGIKKEVALRKNARTPWRFTYGGVMFMPSGDKFDGLVTFLHDEGDGLWSVGQRQKHGKAQRLAASLPLPEALKVAYDKHPTGKLALPKLQGPATEGQLAYMERLGVQHPHGAPTKDEAGELITKAIVSGWLD